jgi:hypothetical protein
MLGPLFQAFEDLGVATDRVIYADDAVEDVRKQLLGLDAVLSGSTRFRTAPTAVSWMRCFKTSPQLASGFRHTRT